MRVMWVCNIPVMRLDKVVGSNAFGGWMTAMATLLNDYQNIKLAICYPQSRTCHIERQHHNGIKFFGFYAENRFLYDDSLYTQFKKIVKCFVPDIIHLFGTEFPHALSVMKLNPGKTLVDIQGMVGIYANHYLTGLPLKLLLSSKMTISCKFSHIYNDMLSYKKRGQYERAALKEARYVTGRTDWDYACIKTINRKATYFFCNRILRESFYGHFWNYENCEKHSIFLSQADYPVKGLHIFLKALSILQKKYNDIKVVVAGTPLNLRKTNVGTYEHYIKKLIKTYHQEKVIKFVGIQDENHMRERYLHANVFVLPSLIENSPNSLGEAMILGVPSVAAYVGGVSSYMEHGIEGFLYQADAEYMLAYYIEKIFEDKIVAKTCSYNAKKRAEKIFDRDRNVKTLIKIYSKIKSE